MPFKYHKHHSLYDLIESCCYRGFGVYLIKQSDTHSVVCQTWGRKVKQVRGAQSLVMETKM